MSVNAALRNQQVSFVKLLPISYFVCCTLSTRTKINRQLINRLRNGK